MKGGDRRTGFILWGQKTAEKCKFDQVAKFGTPVPQPFVNQGEFSVREFANGVLFLAKLCPDSYILSAKGWNTGTIRRYFTKFSTLRTLVPTPFTNQGVQERTCGVFGFKFLLDQYILSHYSVTNKPLVHNGTSWPNLNCGALLPLPLPRSWPNLAGYSGPTVYSSMTHFTSLVYTIILP